MRTVTPYDSNDTGKNIDFYNRTYEEAIAKTKVDPEAFEAALEYIGAYFGGDVMRPDRVGGLVLDSGLSAVDPRHFDKVEYLAVYAFLDSLYCDTKTLWQARHELSLMLQEIHDLRAVLEERFSFDWPAYRRHFPLIAQEVV